MPTALRRTSRASGAGLGSPSEMLRPSALPSPPRPATPRPAWSVKSVSQGSAIAPPDLIQSVGAFPRGKLKYIDGPWLAGEVAASPPRRSSRARPPARRDTSPRERDRCGRPGCIEREHSFIVSDGAAADHAAKERQKDMTWKGPRRVCVRTVREHARRQPLPLAALTAHSAHSLGTQDSHPA